MSPPSTYPSDIDLIDPELLNETTNLQLTARKIVSGVLAGIHQSPRRGSSIQFSEHKLYTPGDDIRHIDWHAYAKTDRFHVKQFEDETNLRVELFVDHSGSMAFASHKLPTKHDYARALASALAMLALSQGDAVGLTTCGGDMFAELPARSKGSHWTEIVAKLATLQPQGTTSLSNWLQLFAQNHRRSVIIIISDLLEHNHENLLLSLKQLAARRHDIAVLHLLDPAEIDFPYDNPANFASMEDSRKLFVHPRALRTSYKQTMKQFLTSIAHSMAAMGIDYQQIRTSTKPTKSLGDFLRNRSTRNR
jgi:uncharacterized protein (DUF58 family)